MIFIETRLRGAFVIEPERIADERGFFARTFCRREFETHNLDPDLVQCSVSYNARRGTLRGMHYQAAPNPEPKVVRCTAGALYDVILDLRPESPTFRQWVAAELSADNRRMVYIPAGMAHGFQTLADGTEVFYQMAAYYHPESARGVRWDDPAFRIEWPAAERILSEHDCSYADFQP